MSDRPRAFLLTVAVLTTAAVILFIVGPATPQVAAGTAGGQVRTITVQGEGLMRIRPDQAVIVLEVAGEGGTAQAAQAETNEAVLAVTQALRQAGVNRAQINVTGMHLGVSDRGFRGVQVLEAEVIDLNRLSDVLDSALASGAIAVRSVTYGLRREAELRQQAVDKAIRDARSRAQAAADSGGVTLLGLRELRVADPGTHDAAFGGPGQTTWRATVEAVFDVR